MLKTKRTFWGVILGVFAAICLMLGTTGFHKTETAYAETVAVTITVKAYDYYNTETQLYCNEQTIVVLDNAFMDIQEQYDSWRGTYHDFRCEIDLKTTIGVDSVDYGDLPMPIIINLNGHDLQLLHSGYWYIKNGLKVNGGDANENRGNLVFPSPTGQPYSGSFWITGGSLEVSDTNISHFNTNKRYPLFAMNTDSSNASFVNCSFKDCHSTSYGGAICMDQSNSLQVRNCSFEDCSSYYGGAIYIEDIVYNGSVKGFIIINSTFKNCSAYYGGAIYIEDNCVWNYEKAHAQMQQFEMMSSSIENCTAEYDGGGIYVDCEWWQLTEIYKISNCTAGRYGGGIFSAGDDSDIFCAEITSCNAKYGGGVYFEDRNPRLCIVSIHDCKATKEGGGYYAEYISDLSTNNCDFYNNSPSNGNATLMSEGTLTIILGIVAGASLITASVFIFLYIKEKKKKGNVN